MIANYSTGVAAERSITEITRMLVKFGVSGISTEYDAQGRAVALSFAIQGPTQLEMYRLPVRIGGTLGVLEDQHAERRFRTMAHAEKVAWRCLRDWVRAQLAIIQAGLTTLDEVMLPYMRTVGGATVYEQRVRQLTAADG